MISFFFLFRGLEFLLIYKVTGGKREKRERESERASERERERRGEQNKGEANRTSCFFRFPFYFLHSNILLIFFAAFYGG